MQRSYLTNRLKGVFVGSGSDGMQAPEVADAIIRLTRKEASEVKVSYLGTATYDLEGPRMNQTKQFLSRGCSVSNIAVGDPMIDVDAAALAQTIEGSDVVVISGGNTLFARGRWEKLGLTAAIRAAAEKGAVMAGGSAGLIMWFDGGHSDSMDPDTYRKAMVKETTQSEKKDEASSAPTASEEAKSWQYIHVAGLGFLPGLACPHYDRTQSNGVPHMADFASMRTSHAGESAICVDHWAALVVDSGRYEVLSLPNKEGSHEGKPWVFADVVREESTTIAKPSPVPPSGSLESILNAPIKIIEDSREATCAAENPV